MGFSELLSGASRVLLGDDPGAEKACKQLEFKLYFILIFFNDFNDLFMIFRIILKIFKIN